MIKTTIAALAFAALTTAAQAQQRTLYDAQGRVAGRSATDSSGAVTHYDAQGKIVTRESVDSAGTKTIYDAKSGRIIGRETPQR